MKTGLFQSCGHCWVFQICWHIECSTFTASSFRIWKSSTGIPSPPLALFVVMLSKAHLTSHSRMSGSRLVITPSWLSGSWTSFFCTVLLCILASLLNIFCFGQVHTISILYCAYLYVKCSLGISNFLEETSSLSHSIIFLCFFALITKEGFLISPAILWNCAFKWVYLSFSPLLLASLLFSAISKASSDNYFAFLHFVLGDGLDHCLLYSIHSSSGTLSDLIPWIYLSLPLYNRKGFDLDHTWMV